MVITCTGDSKGKKHLNCHSDGSGVLSMSYTHFIASLNIKKGHNSARLSVITKKVTVAGICKSIIKLVIVTDVC